MKDHIYKVSYTIAADGIDSYGGYSRRHTRIKAPDRLAAIRQVKERHRHRRLEAYNYRAHPVQ